MAVLDSNQYWNADPDPGAWKLTKTYKKTWILAFQKGFCAFVGMFFVNFSCKKLNFLVLGSLTRIQIRMDPHWFGSLDPDPQREKKLNFGSGLYPSRIHITGSKNCGLNPPQNQQAQWQVVTTVPWSCESREHRRGRRRRG